MSHCKTIHKKTTIRAAMLRSGRARHLAWSETRQEADAAAVIQMSDVEDWESQTSTQIDDDAASDHLASSNTAPEAAARPSTAPVTGESFCQCDRGEEPSTDFGVIGDCLCGEEDQGFNWVWDERCVSTGASLSCDSRKVSFHSDYSCGTAAIRGTEELSEGQHFWEVKMTSPVYGTDMMVGIGTSEVNLEKFKYNFGSLLGHDEDSWGLSYTGLFQYKGNKVKFSSRFGQGSIIGMHLDTWHGTLTFYKNRHCIGVAATRLQNKKIYPMVCSTAAKSSMKVIRACYTPTSLQYLCCARLRRMWPGCPDVLGALELPPGLHNLLSARLGWVFTLSAAPDATEPPEDAPEGLGEEPSLPSSPVSTLSACPTPSPGAGPDATASRCPCDSSAQTPPGADYDSRRSEPEDYQCKRCRWT